jgi:hypothetical protein
VRRWASQRDKKIEQGVALLAMIVSPVISAERDTKPRRLSLMRLRVCPPETWTWVKTCRTI